MGTDVTIKITNLVIPADNVLAAHQALKDLWTDKPTGWLLKRREASFNGPEKWGGYVWVHYRAGGWPSLVEEIDAWPFKAKLHKNGSVEVAKFVGEKWDDEEALFRAIAPFVRGKAEVYVVSEEGHEYRYLFDSGSIRLEHRIRRGKEWEAHARKNTAWTPMSFWGEGPEREEGIKGRAERKALGLGY